MKKKSLIIVVLFVLIYFIPLSAVIIISKNEIKKYDEDTDFNMDITAYGGIEKIIRMDIREYYPVDMKVTCIEESKIVCSNEAEIECEAGDEIHKNQVLAKDKGNIIRANFDGYILNVEYGEQTIVKYHDFSKLVYEAQVDEDKYNSFTGKKFQNVAGDRIKMLEKSNIIEEGKFKAYMTIPDKNAIYGKEIVKYELYTGTVYKKALVVKKGCVYSIGDKKYIRIVDENGLFLEDREVEVGFENDEFVCISGNGIEEGEYCDSGYAKVEEGISEED